MSEPRGVALRYLGHSAVELGAGGHVVLIDPFITHNPAAPVKQEELSPTFIVVTHAHGDHWGDTEALSRRSGAVVISSAEISGHASSLGLQAHGMNLGGSHAFDFGRVRFTPAWHSSSFGDGRYGGMPMGVVLEMGGVRLYHAGDTALFSDMGLIGARGLDVALLPIGDNYTMGPDDAIEAVKLLKPRRVIPIHFNTFPLIAQDAAEFKRRVEAETEAWCTPLAPGESLQLQPS